MLSNPCAASIFAIASLSVGLLAFSHAARSFFCVTWLVYSLATCPSFVDALAATPFASPFVLSHAPLKSNSFSASVVFLSVPATPAAPALAAAARPCDSVRTCDSKSVATFIMALDAAD